MGHEGVRGILDRAGMLIGRGMRTKIQGKPGIINYSADGCPCLSDCNGPMQPGSL